MALHTLKTYVKAWLLERGMILSKPPGQFNVAAYKLKTIRDRGLKVDRAIDGGAATGEWTDELLEVYPHARVIMVEPRSDCRDELGRRCSSNPRLSYFPMLLGPRQEQVTFHEDGSASSIADRKDQTAGGSVRSMTTIDDLIAQAGWDSVDLIKLDLQGYELQALEGATRAIRSASVVLLEVSFIRFLPGLPLAHEVLAYLDRRGFQLYDISGLWSRPLDGALAQGDFIFLRQDHPLLKDTRWADGQ